MKLINNKYFLAVFVLIFYLTEGVAKYYYYYDLERINSLKYIKGFAIIIFISYIIFYKKSKSIFNYLSITILFIVGQLFLKDSEIDFINLTIILKYIFPLVLLDFAYLHFDKNTNIYFLRSFEFLIIINSILILFGFLFKIFLFKTYFGDRFGFDGLFITSAGASYFYVITLFYLYVNLNKGKYYVLLFIISILSSILTGTKTLYLFIMMLFIYHAIIKKNKFTIKNLTISAIVVLCLSILFFILESSYIDFIKNEGLLTSIVSYRDKLLLNKTIPFITNHWSLSNYFFGGISKTTLRSQLGFVDLFFTLGLIGGFLYIYRYFKSLIKVIINKDIIFILISISILIFLGGNFFFNATIAIYLVFLQQLFISGDNEIS